MSEHLGEDLATLALGNEDSIKKHSAHLTSCPDCARALDEAKRVMSALDQPALEPSMGFDRALFARLDAIDAASPWARIKAWFTLPRLIGAGVMALGVSLVLMTMTPLATPDEAVLASIEDDDVAENLDMLTDLDVVEDLDVAEDLEDIVELDEGSPG